MGNRGDDSGYENASGWKEDSCYKEKDDWRLSLDNLLGGKLDVSEERDDEDGLGYAQYLAAVMILRDAQDKAFRSMAVAEMHMISQGVSNFRLKTMYMDWI